MWRVEYEKTFPGLDVEAVWAAWADVERWPEWDKDLESVRLSGPFQAGARFKLKPKGGPEVDIEILSADPAKGFTDFARFPLARMYDAHEMARTPQGLTLKSAIWVEGPLSWVWRKIVAEGVAAGVPAQMEALAEHLRRAAKP